MANEISIDLSDPAMAEALADCNPGDTHTITMDVTVTEKATELTGVVDPVSVEKYGAEEEEVYEEAPPAPVEGAPPAPVAAVM